MSMMLEEDSAATKARLTARLRQQVDQAGELARFEFAQSREQGRDADRERMLELVKSERRFKDLLRMAETLADPATCPYPMTEIVPNIFLGSYEAVQDTDLMVAANIKRVLSVCVDLHPSKDQQSELACLTINALDTPEQNLLNHVDEAIQFIGKNLEEPVLVYCHAGQSRSVFMVAAFLMHTYKLTVDAALEYISTKRNIDLSSNFRRQLHVYEQCGLGTGGLDRSHEAYQTWEMQHRMAPHSWDTPQAQDKVADVRPSMHMAIRCKKCRFVLASEKHLQEHTPKQPSTVPCAHLFIDPVRWMKAELDKGLLEGKFTCPGKHCQAKIGHYAWQGMNCSCRAWILPGLALQRSRVDVLKTAEEAQVEPARRAQ